MSACVIKITQPLTFATVMEVDTIYQPQLQSSALVHVDLNEVTRTDSAGLALLIKWLRQTLKHNGELAYFNASSQLLTLAHLSGVQECLPFVQN